MTNTYRPSPAIRRAVSRAADAIIAAVYAGTDPRAAVEEAIRRTSNPEAAAAVRDWMDHGGVEAIEADVAAMRSAIAS